VKQRLGGAIQIVAVLALVLGLCLGLPCRRAAAQGRTAWDVYVVGWGETLESIAATYHITATQLARDNGMPTQEPLVVGQRLLVPGPSVQNFPQHWPTHVVRSGDTVASIALKYNVSPTHILAANDLRPFVPLTAGAKLVIPVKPYRPVLSLPTAAPKPGKPLFRYGANVYLLDQPHEEVLNGIRGIGFEWLRQELRWAAIEWKPGEYDWSELDRLVADATAKGVKVLLQVGGFPGTAASASRDDLRLTDDEMQRYAALLGQMAARYRGQVQAYEIWDAPNTSPVWGGAGLMSAAEYVKLLKLAHTAVKAADSKAIVVTAALMPTGSHNPRESVEPADYLQQMYESGAKGYFDALGAQSWGYNNPPEDDPSRSTADTITFKGSWHFYFRSFELLRPVMERNGDKAKQIWLVKFGWASSTAQIEGREYAADNTEEEQAIYLVRAYTTVRKQYSYLGFMAFWNFNYAPQVATNDIRGAYSIIHQDKTARLVMETLASMPKE